MGSDFSFNSYEYSITTVRVIMYIRLRCVSHNMLSTTCSVPIVDVGKREAHRQLVHTSIWSNLKRQHPLLELYLEDYWPGASELQRYAIE